MCARVLAIASAHAYGVNPPFRLTGDEWPGLSNCRFNSYAQCQVSASGRALTWIANPYFAGQSDDPYACPNRPCVQAPGYSPNYSWPR
ncbi:DUF3551 domain-containing protein [Bradyrhizobium centrolobii]|uniref:DUF3551 domain-containing protein n=1 Tax=Bradyrhizobium centrolobii TaxID=1505087 RepID=UPI003D31785D